MPPQKYKKQMLNAPALFPISSGESIPGELLLSRAHFRFDSRTNFRMINYIYNLLKKAATFRSTMPEKILYYLGAGASAQCLPLAKAIYDDDMELKIPGLAYELKGMNFEYIFEKLTDDNDREKVAEMKQRAGKLALKADEFGDVDTYAKYLYLKNSTDELESLKRTLSEFFSIRQLLENAQDKRYLPWLVSIMDSVRFPEAVKILNWNYDFQFELASTHFGQLEDVDHGSSSFSYGGSNISHWPNIDPTFSDFAQLSIVHMNGTAGFIKKQDFKTASAFQSKFKGDAKKLLSFLTDKSLRPQINFAWERSDYHAKTMEHIKLLTSGTTILVVIGYSFPFFNRKIDKDVIQYLLGQNSLKKIYYQDPILTGEQLKSQFGIPNDFDIVHIENINNFHVPFEY